MKKISRFISLMLAAVMLSGLMITANAAGHRSHDHRRHLFLFSTTKKNFAPHQAECNEYLDSFGQKGSALIPFRIFTIPFSSFLDFDVQIPQSATIDEKACICNVFRENKKESKPDCPKQQFMILTPIQQKIRTFLILNYSEI